MSALLAAVCYTLIVLAFCQVIIEAVLPPGSTKRYVMFLVGFVTVLAVLQIFTMSREDVTRLIFTKAAELRQSAETQQPRPSTGPDPYREYLEKLMDTYR